MDSEAFESEDDSCKTGPLDLWNCVVQHALVPEFLSVDPEAFPGRGPPGSSCSLFSFTPTPQIVKSLNVNNHANLYEIGHKLPSVPTKQQHVNQQLLFQLTLKLAQLPKYPCQPSSCDSVV